MRTGVAGEVVDDFYPDGHGEAMHGWVDGIAEEAKAAGEAAEGVECGESVEVGEDLEDYFGREEEEWRHGGCIRIRYRRTVLLH